MDHRTTTLDRVRRSPCLREHASQRVTPERLFGLWRPFAPSSSSTLPPSSYLHRCHHRHNIQIHPSSRCLLASVLNSTPAIRCRAVLTNLGALSSLLCCLSVANDSSRVVTELWRNLRRWAAAMKTSTQDSTIAIGNGILYSITIAS